MKVGDLVYCHPYDRHGMIVEFSHTLPNNAHVFIVLWSTGDLAHIAAAFVEVVNEI